MQRDRKLHVQTEEGKSTDLAKPTEPTLRLAEGIARGAAIIAGLTILSRIPGLVRTLVFSQTVGASSWVRRTSPRTRYPISCTN